MKHLSVLLLIVAAALTAVVKGAESEQLRAGVARYDQDYPAIGYSGVPTQNRLSRLKQQLESGQLSLEWEPKWGYLRALLQALDIHVDSQLLVHSKTSLQSESINAAMPRAIYFNDDTHVAWVQGSPLLELTSMDAAMGPVFFVMDNRRESVVKLAREGGGCLSCHDNFSMTGGGVPRILAMSAPVDDPRDTRTFSSATDVDDRTPLAQRWGGWYVTGRHGKQAHFGNMPLRESLGGEQLRKLLPERGDLQSLAGYFDTSAYLTDKSDIVALLVLEHQSWVQNLITRANYKVRSLIARNGRDTVGEPQIWADVGERDQKALRTIVEGVVRGLFFADAAPLEDRIAGSNGFAERFSKLAPQDSKGRSLRQLALYQRVFRYPLSYLVYSPQLDSLPPYVRDYIDSRVVEVLQGRDTTGISARLDPADRTAITQILLETHPRLASRLQGRPR